MKSTKKVADNFIKLYDEFLFKRNFYDAYRNPLTYTDTKTTTTRKRQRKKSRCTMELTPSAEELAVLEKIAGYATKTNLLPPEKEKHAMTILLIARELRIPPMQALMGGINFFKGKAELSARFMNVKIRQAKHELKIETSDDFCEIKGTRADTKETHTVRFSSKDAERAGLKKSNATYEKYPKSMYFARALSILARELFPDVIGECYVEDELERDEVEKKDQPVKSKNTEVSDEKTSEILSVEIPVEVTDSSISDEELEELLALAEAIANPLKKEEVKEFLVKGRSKIKSSEMEKYRNRISTSVQKNEILESQYMELVQLCGKLPIKEDRLERIEWLSKMKDTLTYDRYLEIKEEIELEIPQS